MPDFEAERRFEQIETRLSEMDRHGTHGMESVRTDLGVVHRDLGKLESSVERIEKTLQAVQLGIAAMPKRTPWPAIVAYLGILLPMYALVIDLITRAH